MICILTRFVRTFAVMIFTSIAALLLAATAALNPPAEDTFEWFDDLDAARELAATEGRPLLIVFR